MLAKRPPAQHHVHGPRYAEHAARLKIEIVLPRCLYVFVGAGVEVKDVISCTRIDLDL